MESEATPVAFTPDNEPYLGRKLLFHFDQLISSAMEQNAVTAPSSHGRTLSLNFHTSKTDNAGLGNMARSSHGGPEG